MDLLSRVPEPKTMAAPITRNPHLPDDRIVLPPDGGQRRLWRRTDDAGAGTGVIALPRLRSPGARSRVVLVVGRDIPRVGACV